MGDMGDPNLLSCVIIDRDWKRQGDSDIRPCWSETAVQAATRQVQVLRYTSTASVLERIRFA
jgi:hypothetical protein